MAESAPQLPEDDIEAAAQQPVPDENAPADGDKSSHSDQLSEVTYEQSLYHYVRVFPATMGCVDFEDLSEMNIVHLMNELAKYDQAMRKDEAAPQDIEHVGDLVHRYSSIDPLRSFLKRVLPKELTWTDDERKRREHVEYWMGQTPDEISPFVDTLARFIVAITGGLSLVVPMLVMRLGETLPKSLTTVSVAVILFSALTSLMFKASNVETLAATAAYAAVLVVFVGTSG